MMKKCRWVWTPQVSHAMTANYYTTKGKEWKSLNWNLQRYHGIQCLQQLYDAELVNELLWEYQTPSNTQYSSEYPDFYEEVKVSISIMDDNPLSLSQDRNPKLYSRKVCSEAHSGIYHNGRTLQARGWMAHKYSEIDESTPSTSPESEYNSWRCERASMPSLPAGCASSWHYLGFPFSFSNNWNYETHHQWKEYQPCAWRVSGCVS